MRTLFLVVATTAILLLTASPAQAQAGINNPNTPTDTILYFHLINVQDMPINTQIPNDDFTDLGAYGPATNTLKCLDPTLNPVTHGTTSQVFHTSRGYSSPSYVEYDFLNANGDPRTHPERGISYDATFDQATPMVLSWYVAIFNGADGIDAIPTPIPNVVVAASMKTGDAISVDDKSYDKGDTIAEGRTAPVILLPGGANGGPFSALPGPVSTTSGSASTEVFYEGQLDGHHIYRFDVTMPYKADRILRATGYNFRIDIFIDNPYCTDPTGPDQLYLMPGVVAPYTDSTHRPRLEFKVTNPIRLEYLHPQFVGDDLVVHTSMNSVWGNYDVDEVSSPDNGGIKVDISGPSPATNLAKAALVQRFHEHYHHQEAVDVTYVWPYKADRATNGLYTVSVAFQNDQHTAEATGTAQFEIGTGVIIGCGGVQESSQKQDKDCTTTVGTDGKDAAKDSPGLPVVVALGALAAVALVLRRRQA